MRKQTPVAASRAQSPSASALRQHDGVFLSGIEALARLPLEQRLLDARRGLNTAGFVSGYRGSPLGGLDRELWKLRTELDAHGVVFQPGVNEDLAATAVWGSQQVGLFPGARHDGVFGMWYGKAPGLDRSCDALRHANAAGTSRHGGALLVVGDDHGCKSSTLPSASEFALRDLGIPVLAPADVQDVLDLGLFGWALSRYAGCWTALVVVTDVADSASSARLRPRDYAAPPHPDGDPHIRLADAPLAQEARLQAKQRRAAAFSVANGVNRIVADCRRPRLAILAAGKVYQDVREALSKLGLRGADAIAAAGIRLVKLRMPWPLGAAFVAAATQGCEQVLVVEAKRPFVEEQLKTMLFDSPSRPRVIGKTGAKPMLPVDGELDVPTIARALATVLGDVPNRAYINLQAGRTAPRAPRLDAADAPVRSPLWCAGCPHNSSTRVPAGSRAVAGIGCHYMAQWMDRNTSTPTHMGAEGANWIGQAPFTNEKHLFVNLGDGTYFHSGILALRAAVAAGVDATYKILVNDAVAMTGGQPVEGSPTVADIVAQVRAEGVADVQVVTDDPAKHRGAAFPVYGRENLDAVQRRLRETPGCTVLVYHQACANELRRERKRARRARTGAAEHASRGSAWFGRRKTPGGKANARVVINDAVCEGCSDCSEQSSCIAVAPLATEHGTKRTIDQSACNQDLACLAGFCPALVTVKGARLRRRGTNAERVDVAALRRRLPAPLADERRTDLLIAGVGGTGVVTASRLLGMAAHLDGKFASTLDMTGLAQKGGAVLSHVRISPLADRHAPTRIPAASADAVLAADMVTAASAALPAMSSERTVAFANAHVSPTAEFVLHGARPDANALQARLRQAARRVDVVDATGLALALFGDTAFANVLLLGFAFQKGAAAVSAAAVERAIAVNGVAVDENLAAFHCGRAAAHDMQLLPAAAQAPASPAMQPPVSRTLDERLAVRRAFLSDYQDDALAARYLTLVARVRAVERRASAHSSVLTEAVAESYFKLLTAKDEYEVARLFAHQSFSRKLAAQFEPGAAPTFYFAPPWLAGGGRKGRPRKIAVPGWVALPAMRLLARARPLRGTWLDPFRNGQERRLNRRLLADFEADCETIAQRVHAGNLAAAAALARWPLAAKGFGPVKAQAARMCQAQRQRLLATLRAPDAPRAAESTFSSFSEVA